MTLLSRFQPSRNRAGLFSWPQKSVIYVRFMNRRSQLFIIFSTVFMDLIGFGMVIPLIGVYGKHYGAEGWSLAALAASFSFMQFIFAPVWGRLSDRFGRRPILLVSLLGQTVSYLIFGLSTNLPMLFASRICAGLFAGNIGAAMAYIADITPREERARGMALVGASFGIGFTLGPPLGGIAAAKLGLSAPGLVASALCGLNFLLALVRLPESLPQELRREATARSVSPLDIGSLGRIFDHPVLWVFVLTFAFSSFAFSNLEQPIPLLIQYLLNLPVEQAGYHAGLVLMAVGLASALTQGFFVRRYGHRFDERTLLITGLTFYLVPALIFPLDLPHSYLYVCAVVIGLGGGLSNPNMTGLISKHSAAHEQGTILGVAQGLGSLGRVLGPLCGLLLFDIDHRLPFVVASFTWLCLVGLNLWAWRRESRAIQAAESA